MAKKIAVVSIIPFLFFSVCAFAEGIHAGACKVDITPPPSLGKIHIAGYQHDRIAKKVHDPVWARCGAITDSRDKTLVLCGLDLIGFMWDDVNEVRGRVAKFSDAYIVLSSTHTHSGPDTLGFWGNSPIGSIPFLGNSPARINPDHYFSDLWIMRKVILKIPILNLIQIVDVPFGGRSEDQVAYIKNQIVAAIKCALDEQKLATLFVSQQELTGLTRNIREDGLIDSSSTVLKAVGQNGTIFFLHNFGVHPEIMKAYAVSSDFVHYWYEETEETHGGVAIFINAALGAMIVPESPNIYTIKELPNANLKKRTKPVTDAWQNAEWYGERVHRKLLSALKFTKLEVPRVTSDTRVFDFKLTNPEFLRAHKLGILKRKSSDRNLPHARTEVGVMRVGQVCAVTVPGEPSPRMGFKLRKVMTEANCEFEIIIGLGNDELGYPLCPEDSPTECRSPYEYECSMRPSPYLCEMVVNSAAEMFNLTR